MKKPSHVLEYPLVVRKVQDSLTVSVPDLSIWGTLELPPKVKTQNGYVTQFNDEYALKVGREVLRTYVRATKHMNEKKWVPGASDIKAVVTKQDKPLTLPAFRNIVAQAVPVSLNTIRRDVDRGVIKCAKTSGRHRRIPGSEVGRYLAYLEGKIKPKGNKSLGDAMKAVEKSLQGPKKKK
jgi:excisionase family DNA binding protein